jgi:hypothetical protein
MVNLPRDILDQLVDIISLDYDALVYLLAFALVSKDFATAAQAHIFRQRLSIQNEGRCARLLDILAHNPALGPCIKHIRITQEDGLITCSYRPEGHWIHTEVAGKLMDRLTNLHTMDLEGIRLDEIETNRLVHYSLRGRLRSLLLLRISTRDQKSVNLDCLARLLSHFPMLGTLEIRSINVPAYDEVDVPPEGWDNAHGRASPYISRIRRLKVTVDVQCLGSHSGAGIKGLPLWFVRSGYLKNLKELDMHTPVSSVLCWSSWNLVLHTAPVLTSLKLSYYFLDDQVYLPLLNSLAVVSAPQLTYFELRHANERGLTPTWMLDVLLALDPSTPLRNIELHGLYFSSRDPGVLFDMKFWHRLDDSIARGFHALESVFIDFYFELEVEMYEGYYGMEPLYEEDPEQTPTSEDVRRAMKNLDQRGVLRLTED